MRGRLERTGLASPVGSLTVSCELAGNASADVDEGFS